MNINLEILDSIDNYILIIDDRKRIVFVNKALLERCEKQKDEVIGKKCYEFSHHCISPCSQTDSGIICPHEDVLRTGKPSRVLHQHILPDGTKRFFDITSTPIISDGDVISIIEVMSDVTEKIELEQRLRESEEKFRSLVEKSLVGVYLIQDGLFKYVNPRLAEFFGYTRDELIDKKGPKDLVYPDDRHIVEENIRKRIDGEIESINYTFRGLRKDGSVFDVEVFGSRTIYRGRPAVIGTLLDITERKRSSEELDKRLRELQKFYDIAIKRELRMIELKREIERLNDELNRLMEAKV